MVTTPPIDRSRIGLPFRRRRAALGPAGRARGYLAGGLVLLGASLLVGVLAPRPADAQALTRGGGGDALRLAAERPVVAAGQWVVRFRKQVSRAVRQDLHQRTGARVLRDIPQLGIQAILLPDEGARSIYARSSAVLWIEPNGMRYPLVAEPNDPAWNEIDYGLPLTGEGETWFEWDARAIRLFEGWNLWPNRYYTAAGKAGQAVRVAVIDTGIDYDHPDFRNTGGSSTNAAQGGQLDRGLDRTFDAGAVTADAWDGFGHGTHVAGIVAAATNNALGVTGNAPHATVLSLRTLDETGDGTEADIAAAIVYAADAGALIANLSLGGYDYSQAEQDAVDYAWERGMLAIAAAGNDGTDLKPNYPGALDRVLAVSATSREESLTLYSNWGPYVGICAPGGDFDFTALWFLGVYSTMPSYHVTLNDPPYEASMNYSYEQGTSMAAPQVAGLAALLAGEQGWTRSTPGVALRLFQALQRGAANLSGGNGWSSQYGWGQIDVAATLDLDAEPNPRGDTVGGITGFVRYRGTRVQNADLVATRSGGGGTVQISTRDDGGFRLPNVPAGTWDVTATYFGNSVTVSDLEIVAGSDTPGVNFDIDDVAGPPVAPSALVAAPESATQVGLDWLDNSDDESAFIIERKDATGGFVAVATLDAGVTGFAATGLEPRTSYVFRVAARNELGDSPPSNEATATTLPLPPVAPGGLVARAISASRIDLAWQDASDDETSFRIERRPAEGTFVPLASVGSGATAYTDTGLAQNKAYGYRVVAINEGGASEPSTEATATTLPDPPPTPERFRARPRGRGGAVLSWADRTTRESAFHVERQDPGGAFREVATLPANSRRWLDSGLGAGQSYVYRTRASNAAGFSPYSASLMVRAR